MFYSSRKLELVCEKNTKFEGKVSEARCTVVVAIIFSLRTLWNPKMKISSTTTKGWMKIANSISFKRKLILEILQTTQEANQSKMWYSRKQNCLLSSQMIKDKIRSLRTP